jgi:Bacteriophage HK97-gp10, putative tail-component
MATGASINTQELRRRLQRAQERIPQAVAQALYQEAEIDATEVKKRTPVLTGNLRASVHVVGPERKGTKTSVEIVAGGPAAPYAIYVHENLESFHHVGQAKFIESVIMETRPNFMARIAKRINFTKLFQ